jgi:ABC-type sugar transport system permease subunit
MLTSWLTFQEGKTMSYQSRKSIGMELSEGLGNDSEFELSPTWTIVFIVVLAFLLMVVK